jgi:RimJ/RimL family protein N-acetyltransferase
MTTPTLPILTERLLLRPMASPDLAAMASYYVRPDVQRHVQIKARDGEECAEALAAMASQVSLNRPGDVLTLAIAARRDRTLLGHISLVWADATAAQGELSVILAPGERGIGYALEAATAMLDLAFEEFRLHRVFARCDGRNSSAARLLKKLGMRLEAHFREHALFMGEWDEELHFALLSREWRRSAKVEELRHKIA